MVCSLFDVVYGQKLYECYLKKMSLVCMTSSVIAGEHQHHSVYLNSVKQMPGKDTGDQF